MSSTAKLYDFGRAKARRERGGPVREPWVKPEAVCGEQGVSLRTLRRWRKRGLYEGCLPLEEFPGAVRRLSRSVVQYRLSRVDAWLAEYGQ